MKFRLVEKLFSSSEQMMINELESICKIYYNWSNKTPTAIKQIYNRHLPEINQFYADREETKKRAEREQAKLAKNKEPEFIQLSMFDEDYEDYNANPYNKNESDCTIRALSLAYDIPYNMVKSELRSFGSRNQKDFNDLDSVKLFIEKHKYKNFFNNERNSDLSIGTVKDFAKKNPHGTYIVYCSNATKQNTSKSFHLVTIINGNIYDTWDSSDYYVLGAWSVNTNPNKLINKVANKK